MNAPQSHFGIVVDFQPERTSLGVRGEVDLLTSSTLHAALNAVVDRSHGDVVLELAGLTFIDASGLRVIADVSERLTRSRRVLIVRSAPAITRRILELTGVIDLIRLEEVEPEIATMLTEHGMGDHARVGDGHEFDSFADVLRAGSKSSYEAIDAALLRVVALVGAAMPGADGVSVTLERDARLATVASSNDTVMRMDDHQYETGQGPCLSAAAEGRWFHIESLAGETRWPAFVPLAIGEGIASILSTPLMTAGGPIGALNIYSNTDRVFGDEQQKVAALFASHASAILTEARPVDESMGKSLADALLTRQTIARAQGALMARYHIAPEKAAAAIHRSARATGVTVAQQAATIVASTHDEIPFDK